MSYENGTHSKVLRFDPLQVLDQNIYLCKVRVVDITQKEFNVTVKSKLLLSTACDNQYLHYFTVPTVSTNITDDGAPPTPGETYNLTCNVYGAEKLNPVITYQWMKENDTEILVGTNSGILSFPLLSISNASNYTCMVTVESNYLEEDIHISTDLFEVKFQGIIIITSIIFTV